MVVVCFVLGLWGIYDLVVRIPWEEQAVERHKLLIEDIQPALETGMASKERAASLVVLQTVLVTGADEHWTTSLEIYTAALGGPPGDLQVNAQSRIASDSKLYEVTKPSKFDWYMQWVFAICIPFAFYYLYLYFKMRGKAIVYCFADDGTLTTPEGTWNSEEIVGIDMSRWIAKTGNARSTWTAKAELGGGKKVVLDDYIYKDMHLIIGALAHRFYPEEWSPLAKRVKNESEDVQIDAQEEEE